MAATFSNCPKKKYILVIFQKFGTIWTKQSRRKKPSFMKKSNISDSNVNIHGRFICVRPGPYFACFNLTIPSFINIRSCHILPINLLKQVYSYCSVCLVQFFYVNASRGTMCLVLIPSTWLLYWIIRIFWNNTRGDVPVKTTFNPWITSTIVTFGRVVLSL